MCVWGRFPRVSRDADFLGIFEKVGLTFSYLDVHSLDGEQYFTFSSVEHPILNTCRDVPNYQKLK